MPDIDAPKRRTGRPFGTVGRAGKVFARVSRSDEEIADDCLPERFKLIDELMQHGVGTVAALGITGRLVHLTWG